jgi:hypothetical protein
MSTTSEFYLARAAEMAIEADKATLDNVRDRCRRSEAAWLSMASRTARSEQMRSRLAEEKAIPVAEPAETGD